VRRATTGHGRHRRRRLPLTDPSRSSLRADCQRCVGLCCVAPAFAASADFAIDKPAGHACPNLRDDFGCSIHDVLRPRGFPGCAVYDCFGAGQQVTQVTFSGRDWRRSPEIADQMFAVFAIVRDLHELLWYLTEALVLEPASALRPELEAVRDETERLTNLGPDALTEVDTLAHQQRVDALLVHTSELVRADVRREATDFRRADLVGKDLSGADLLGADLRGASLIGADLRGADLRLADVIGADFRGADLTGADASTSIFLTQFQVNGAKGDVRTKLPPSLDIPSHWTPRRPSES
jgi:uncharacterized protein YjbI with pentapeptide repeats